MTSNVTTTNDLIDIDKKNDDNNIQTPQIVKTSPSKSNNQAPVQPQPQSNAYKIDDEWTQDIDEYNPQSFVKEYPLLKKELEIFNLDPVSSTSVVIKMINKYQEKPELLDHHLPEICDMLMKYIQLNIAERDPLKINDPTYITNCVFKVIYTLSIVRGYKTIVRYLPHEVTDLEPTLQYLLVIDQNELTLWYTRYVLCIWLSIIVRVPFNLNTIDSYGDMIDNIINITKLYLSRSEKSREGAAVLISRLFSRPDFEQTHMSNFFKWSLDSLEKYNENDNIFLFTGIFRALAETFKHAHRDALLPHAKSILDRAGKIWAKSKSRVVRKYSTKLLQRVGLVFLKPVIASWRYQKGRHVLMSGKVDNSDKNNNKNANDDNKINDKQFSDNFMVPSEIEDILNKLLGCLTDKETVVRWSAAKGIGRITMRLPKTLGDEVISNVLELLSPTENYQAWHGGCLCLAELSRRGLLLPIRIPDVIDRVSKAMIYDIFQGQSSVGDQVRDAACYVAWAFARAYEPNLMKPYVNKLSKSLLTMAVFDKEIHCRRAACAAFQENVGRQGNFAHGIEIVTTADYWSVGLLSNAYLVVSKSIAKFNEYKHYLIDHLVNDKLTYWDLKIRQLSGRALCELTELDTNYMISNVLPILINRCQSQSVFERHGALCGLSQIINRLHELKVIFPNDLQKKIKNVVPKLEKNRGYRGRGGERIRQQSCNVIQAFCNAKFMLTDKGIDRMQQTIDENLRIPQDFVQTSALNALKALSTNYYNTQQSAETNNRLKKIPIKWCNELKTEIIASVTRGYSRGLGTLSKYLILPNLKLVVDTLINKSLLTEKEDTRDFETRKMCCIALADLIENIGVSENYIYSWNIKEDEKKDNDDDDDDDDQLRALGIDLDLTKVKHSKNKHYKPIEDEKFEWKFDISNKEKSSLLYDRIINALILRFEDYEVDRRGDVGSFVREHNMKQIYRIMVMLAKAGNKSNNQPWLRPKLPTLILNLILRQLAEKLDRVRRAAGRVIELIFDNKDPDVQNIRFDNDVAIRSIFANYSTIDGGLDWSSPALVFPLLIKCLYLDSYRRSVIEGLIQSIGSINSQMSSLALKAFEPYMNKSNENYKLHPQESIKQLVLISNDIIYCIKKRHLNPLFMIPFLKTIGIILSDRDWFDILRENNNLIGNKFALTLYKQLKKECYKSTDIMKLLQSVKVFIGLILFNSTKELSLQRLLIFLGYQYPALRKKTCNELASAICTHEILSDENKQNQIFDYLSENVWGGTDLDKIRKQRNKLFDMFEIDTPKLKGFKKKNKKKLKKKTVKTDNNNNNDQNNQSNK